MPVMFSTGTQSAGTFRWYLGYQEYAGHFSAVQQCGGIAVFTSTIFFAIVLRPNKNGEPKKLKKANTYAVEDSNSRVTSM